MGEWAITLLGEVFGRRKEPKAEQNIVVRSRVLRNNCFSHSPKFFCPPLSVPWVDQLEMNRMCAREREQEAPTFHYSPSKLDVQGSKKVYSEEGGAICWVIGLAWNSLQTIHWLRKEQTTFLICGIQSFSRTFAMICSHPRRPINSWGWWIIVLVAKLVILWRMIWFVELTVAGGDSTRPLTLKFDYTGWLDTILRFEIIDFLRIPYLFD